MMKKYLVYTRTNAQSKNKLQRTVSMMLHDIDRSTVGKEDLEFFITHINNKLSAINQCFPRCTPFDSIYLQKWDLENAEKKEISDFHFSLNNGQFSINLYQFKETTDR